MAFIMGLTESTATVASGVNSGLAALPLMSKGLLTTLCGLLGVFLVLTLFFFAIKMMQRIKDKNENK